MLVQKGAGKLLDTVQVLEAETWFSRESGSNTPYAINFWSLWKVKGLNSLR